MGGLQFLPGQPRQKVCETPSQVKKLGVVAHACHSSNSRKLKLGGSWFRPPWAKSKSLPLNNHSKNG
jgi:hypothetical protein